MHPPLHAQCDIPGRMGERDDDEHDDDDDAWCIVLLNFSFFLFSLFQSLPILYILFYYCASLSRHPFTDTPVLAHHTSGLTGCNPLLYTSNGYIQIHPGTPSARGSRVNQPPLYGLFALLEITHKARYPFFLFSPGEALEPTTPAPPPVQQTDLAPITPIRPLHLCEMVTPFPYNP